MNPPFAKADATTFTACLRYSIVETWREMQLLVTDKERSSFHLTDNPIGIEELFTLDCYLKHLLDIGQWRAEEKVLSYNDVAPFNF